MAFGGAKHHGWGPRGWQSKAVLRTSGISIPRLDSLILLFIEVYSYIDGVK